MKLSFYLAIILFPFELFGQCKDFVVQVKDPFGYPVPNAKVSIEYASNTSSSEYKMTSSKGEVKFSCKYPNAKPSVKIAVNSKGYEAFTRRDTWGGSESRTITLKEEPAFSTVRSSINGKKSAVQNTLKEVQKEIATKQTEPNSDPSLVQELEGIKLDLETKQNEYDSLLRESSSHEQSAAYYQALLEEKNQDYEELRTRFVEIKNAYVELKNAIAIELFDCKCDGWNEDYIKLSFRVKDGRSKSILTSTHELALDIKKKGKSNEIGEYLLFSNEEDNRKYSFLFRPNEEGYSTVIVRPNGNAFEREYKKLGDHPFNYTITFYNKALFDTRSEFKIPLGSVEIIDINDLCGNKKKLPVVP